MRLKRQFSSELFFCWTQVNENLLLEEEGTLDQNGKVSVDQFLLEVMRTSFGNSCRFNASKWSGCVVTHGDAVQVLFVVVPMASVGGGPWKDAYMIP